MARLERGKLWAALPGRVQGQSPADDVQEHAEQLAVVERDGTLLDLVDLVLAQNPGWRRWVARRAGMKECQGCGGYGLVGVAYLDSDRGWESVALDECKECHGTGWEPAQGGNC